jgi:hypothetical protein
MGVIRMYRVVSEICAINLSVMDSIEKGGIQNGGNDRAILYIKDTDVFYREVFKTTEKRDVVYERIIQNLETV